MNAALASLLLVCVAAPVAAAQTGAATLERHVNAAHQAQAAQDCVTAAKEYAAAVRLMPTSGELRTNQGIALYCSQQLAEAKIALQKALALNSALTVPHLFLGLTLFHLSDTHAAIRELGIAATKMPADVTSRLWLGYSYLEAHQNGPAAVAFADVLRLDPNNVDARYALGQAFFATSRQRAQELVTQFPKGRGIRMLVAQQSIAGKSEASPSADLSAWKSPQEEALYREASDAEQKAQETLQVVIEKYPTSDRAHEIQGDIASLQRNNEVAIAEYTEVLKTNPTLPGVRLAMANCLMQSSQFAKALEALTMEKRLTPHSADVLTSMGRVQLSLGKDDDAIASFKEAITFPSAPPAARLLMGKALLRAGDAKTAVPLLEQALHDGADPATANYLLARAYRGTGDRAAAARSLTAYHHFSQDEAERQAAAAITQGPASVPTSMSSQETQEASNMSGQLD